MHVWLRDIVRTGLAAIDGEHGRVRRGINVDRDKIRWFVRVSTRAVELPVAQDEPLEWG